MNFLQLINRVRQNCGVSGADYPTSVGLTGEGLRLKNWVNEAWMELQNQREDWQWMRKSFAFPTVAGQPFYTAAQIGITDFGLWARDTFRNYANPQVTISLGTPASIFLQGHAFNLNDTVQFFTSGALPTGFSIGTTYYVSQLIDSDHFALSLTSGGASIGASGTQSGIQTITSNNTTTYAGFKSEIYMEYDEYDNWRNAYEYGALRLQKTRPLNVTITPLKALGFGPFPDAGYTIVGDYYSVPTEMVADTDIPALPPKFHYAIVYLAMIAYGTYESAQEVIERGGDEYGKYARRIHNDQMIEIAMAGPLC